MQEEERRSDKVHLRALAQDMNLSLDAVRGHQVVGIETRNEIAACEIRDLIEAIRQTPSLAVRYYADPGSRMRRARSTEPSVDPSSVRRSSQFWKV